MGTRLDVVGTTTGKITLETHDRPYRPMPSIPGTLMTGGSITGVVGRITWSYHVCAEIDGYVVTRSPENRWSLVGTPKGSSNTFHLRQRPLMFVAPTAHGDMCFPIETIDVGPNHIRATLGKPL